MKKQVLFIALLLSAKGFSQFLPASSTDAANIYRVGNLGIGTTAAPTANKLEVVGSSKFTGSANFTGGINADAGFFTKGALSIAIPSGSTTPGGSTMTFKNDNYKLGLDYSIPVSPGSYRFVTFAPSSVDIGSSTTTTNLTVNGKVGIGTITPSAKLHVVAPSTATAIDAMIVDVASFGTTANAEASTFFKVRDVGAANYTPFIIKGNGNVGVGAEIPTSKLHINGDEKKALRIFRFGGETSKYLSLWHGTAGAVIDPVGTGKLYLGYDQKTDVLIGSQNDGSLGIGVAAPEGKLDINANGFTPIIRGNGGYIPTGLRFIDDSYTQAGQVKEWSIWKGNTWAKGLGFMRYDAVNRCAGGICDLSLFLSDNGNVGIGTTEPENAEGWDRALEVKGNNHAKILTSSSGITTGLFSHVSGYYGTVGGGIVGTTTNHPFSIVTNKVNRLVVSNDGKVGIGKLQPNEKLDVDGSIANSGDIIANGSNSWIFHTPDDGRKSLHIAPKGTTEFDFSKSLVINNNGNMAFHGKFEAKEIKVVLTPTADFVFANDYKLPTLESVEKHIKEKKHLPEIASAKEMEKEGVNVGEFQIKLLQKIEELTLYAIEQQKKLEAQSKAMELMSNRLEKLEKK